MIDHCNRWLLGFAAAYLALLPTNTATFVRSVAFGGAVVLALVVLGLARRDDPAEVPSPGWPVVAALVALVPVVAAVARLVGRPRATRRRSSSARSATACP